MNTKPIVVGILFVVVVGAVGNAGAERIKANSKQSGKAQSDCVKNGGVEWPQSAESPTYGCIDKNGHGLVCGGGTAEQKATCDTFRTLPPRLPTRDEIFLAEQAAARQAEGDKASAP